MGAAPKLDLRQRTPTQPPLSLQSLSIAKTGL
jgi:hypothetical protein